MYGYHFKIQNFGGTLVKEPDNNFYAILQNVHKNRKLSLNASHQNTNKNGSVLKV